MRNRSKRKAIRSNKAMTERFPKVEIGSGNVFADIGLPHPEIALAKAKLVHRIRDLIVAKRLTQVEAAELLGLDQPKISGLVHGKVEGYTIDRLIRILNSLGQRVQISIQPAVSTIRRPASAVVDRTTQIRRQSIRSE